MDIIFNVPNHEVLKKTFFFKSIFPFDDSWLLQYMENIRIKAFRDINIFWRKSNNSLKIYFKNIVEISLFLKQKMIFLRFFFFFLVVSLGEKPRLFIYIIQYALSFSPAYARSLRLSLSRARLEAPDEGSRRPWPPPPVAAAARGLRGCHCAVCDAVVGRTESTISPLWSPRANLLLVNIFST